MNRRIRKELNELRHSPIRTVRTMHEEFLHIYPRATMALLLPQMYHAWLQCHEAGASEQRRKEMYEFYHWLHILAETQYIFEERGSLVPANAVSRYTVHYCQCLSRLVSAYPFSEQHPYL